MVLDNQSFWIPIKGSSQDVAIMDAKQNNKIIKNNM